MNEVARAQTLLPVLALVAARVVPVVAWLPAFGGRTLPWALRLGFGAALATFIGLRLPNVRADLASLPMADPSSAGGFIALALMLIREAAVGLSLAFLTSLVFMAADIAGRLADLARRSDGEAAATPLSFHDGGQSALAVLYTLFAALLFAELGGPGHVIAALVRSYEVLPLTGAVAAAAPLSLIRLVGRIVGGTVEVAVALAAPVMLAVWLSELTLSLVMRVATGRIAAGMAAGPALAPLIGIGVTLLGLGVVRAGLEGWLAQLPAVLLRTAEAWARG